MQKGAVDSSRDYCKASGLYRDCYRDPPYVESLAGLALLTTQPVCQSPCRSASSMFGVFSASPFNAIAGLKAQAGNKIANYGFKPNLKLVPGVHTLKLRSKEHRTLNSNKFSQVLNSNWPPLHGYCKDGQNPKTYPEPTRCSAHGAE